MDLSFWISPRNDSFTSTARRCALLCVYLHTIGVESTIPSVYHFSTACHREFIVWSYLLSRCTAKVLKGYSGPKASDLGLKVPKSGRGIAGVVPGYPEREIRSLMKRLMRVPRAVPLPTVLVMGLNPRHGQQTIDTAPMCAGGVKISVWILFSTFTSESSSCTASHRY